MARRALCRDCYNTKRKEARRAAATEINAKRRSLRAAEPGAAREKARAYYRANAEAVKKSNREWRHRNPDKAKAHDAGRALRKQPTAEQRKRYSVTSYYRNGGAEASRKRQRAGRSFFPADLFQQRLAEQGGVCAICKQEFRVFRDGRSTACADHDHARKLPRGVLCYHCNVGLGHYEKHQKATLAIAPYDSYLAGYCK